ncbi:MAG: DUF3795 domain-containing protein [Candidatus Aenigmatarchaeota archaeon]
MLVGSCGIACETCGLYTRGICEGCEHSQEQVEFLKSIDANCPVLECAVSKDIEVCSRDCNQFPCETFERWPFANDWLEMFRERLKNGG